jgi:hypothetical protein
MNDLIALEDFADTMHTELNRVQMLADATGPFHDAERAAALIEQLATLACATLLAARMNRQRFEADAAADAERMTEADFDAEGWNGPGRSNRFAVTIYTAEAA